jgi:hypothetical protein
LGLRRQAAGRAFALGQWLKMAGQAVGHFSFLGRGTHAPHLVADVITCSPALRGNSCIR